ncbi:MAG: hypothetical protein JWO59_2939, partial [Chloroflexi bacterium]|nr:hypothetical protein [Chloroflexota bacterium]
KVGDSSRDGTVPTGAEGVKVTRVEMCVPHFFVGVMGFGNFDVASDGQSVSTPSETEPYCDASGCRTAPPSARANFYVFARTSCTDLSSPNNIPSCTGPSPTGTTYRLFANGSPDSNGYHSIAYTPNCSSPATWCNDSITGTPYTGVLVTLHDQSNGQGNWDVYQYANPVEALRNKPGVPLSIGSQADRGCLNPATTSLAFGQWSFNRNGNGIHCSKSPTDGSTVVVPFVDQVCKNTNGQPTVCDGGTSATEDPSICVNGGYCVRVMGQVQVTIVRDLSDGDLVQGYITGVVDDPYCMVEAPTGQHPSPASTLAFGAGTALTGTTGSPSVGARTGTLGVSTVYSTVTLGGATGGTFDLSVTNAGTTQTATGIAFNASAATVKSALEALSNVHAGNVTVTGAGTTASPYSITFTGAASGEQPLSDLGAFPTCRTSIDQP